MKKPSDLTSKICRDLQANGFVGIAFVGDNKAKTGSSTIKADKGEDVPRMLAECIK